MPKQCNIGTNHSKHTSTKKIKIKKNSGIFGYIYPSDRGTHDRNGKGLPSHRVSMGQPETLYAYIVFKCDQMVTFLFGHLCFYELASSRPNNESNEPMGLVQLFDPIVTPTFTRPS